MRWGSWTQPACHESRSAQSTNLVSLMDSLGTFRRLRIVLVWRTLGGMYGDCEMTNAETHAHTGAGTLARKLRSLSSPNRYASGRTEANSSPPIRNRSLKNCPSRIKIRFILRKKNLTMVDSGMHRCRCPRRLAGMTTVPWLKMEKLLLAAALCSEHNIIQPTLRSCRAKECLLISQS